MSSIEKIFQQISNLGIKEEFSDGMAKRIQLFNQMTLVAVGITAFYTFYFPLIGYPDYFIPQIIGTLLCASVFWVTKKGHCMIAQTYLLVILVVNIGSWSIIVPDVRAELLVFCLVGIPLLVFEKPKASWLLCSLVFLSFFAIEFWLKKTGLLPPLELSPSETTLTKSINVAWSLIGILIVTFYTRYGNDKYEMNLLTKNKIINERNLEILDSITYAKRIQDAILPPIPLVKENLKNSFILYKPKDIVAGDFYWMERLPPLSASGQGIILLAAADCTGHGVPGAMVSVVCNNALNRSVREFGLTSPGEILDKTRELVIETFNTSQKLGMGGEDKSDGDVKDGMDISLCSLNTATNELLFSGANNGIMIIREGTENVEQTEELKGDKQPIGSFANLTPFTTHKIQLHKNDSFYIFSDGYADQFGGEKGKKLKYKPLRELLTNNYHKPMHEQHAILDQFFEEWKGDLEQVDDVCIIGVRI